MKAVNLIPPEQRRGSPGTPSRSGGAVYILLGFLGVLVVAVAAYVLTTNSIQDKKAELGRLANKTTAAEAQAAALKPYRDFAAMRQTRAATVSSLAASRFDWERAIRQLSIVLPDDVWLTSLVGTVAPGVSLSGGAGSSSALRGAQQGPAIELIGCTTSQAEVARVMVRLRQMDDVTRVSLSSSDESASAAGSTSGASPSASGGGSASGDCRRASTRFPQFQVVIFFRPLAGATAGGGSGGGAAAAAQAPPSSAQKAQGAVSTTGSSR
jgi:Tfp pilus assembly protein PilN